MCGYTVVTCDFKKNFYWSIVNLQCCKFQVYIRVNLLYISTYPLFFRFFSHVRHYRVLSSFLCYTVSRSLLVMLSILYIVVCV